jgi:benzoate membrane transport protein
VVAASGLSFLGIGAAFWALAGGLLVRGVLSFRCPKSFLKTQ